MSRSSSSSLSSSAAATAATATRPPPSMAQLGGAALASACVHAMRMGNIGLRQTDDMARVIKRIVRPDLRAAVFLDLDETLTAQNVAPEEYLAGEAAVDDAAIERYMHARVPPALRERVKAFLRALDAAPDVEWFILTDNVYAMARCTMRLAFDIDTPPGTILDRLVRADARGGARHYQPKHETIANLMLERARAGLAPLRVVFADNLHEQRAATTAQMQYFRDMRHDEQARFDAATERWRTVDHMSRIPFVACCADLDSGLRGEHIDAMLRFLDVPAEQRQQQQQQQQQRRQTKKRKQMLGRFRVTEEAEQERRRDVVRKGRFIVSEVQPRAAFPSATTTATTSRDDDVDDGVHTRTRSAAMHAALVHQA